MASKQFNLEPGLSNLYKTGKSSNPSVSKVDEASKKDLKDLFQDFYDEYFDCSKIMKSSTTNVKTLINGEVFHEVSESFQRESSLFSLNDDVKQSLEEVILPLSNTQSIPIEMVPIGDEASTSHNVFNKRLKDAYFDASTSFHDPSNVQTYYQPYPYEKNSIEPANVAEALRDADRISAMQEELDQFARVEKSKKMTQTPNVEPNKEALYAGLLSVIVPDKVATKTPRSIFGSKGTRRLKSMAKIGCSACGEASHHKGICKKFLNQDKDEVNDEDEGDYEEEVNDEVGVDNKDEDDVDEEYESEEE
nr:hypothetical protein [Tanacetum cinerariifolium]